MADIQPRRALAAAAFGVFVAADDLLVVSTMLRPIIGHLGLALPDDLDTAAWIVNVYLIAYLAVMPLAGRLSDVVGRQRVFNLALAVFAVGSLIVPLAPNLPVFLFARALTAIGGGALVPVALAIAADVFSGPGRSRAFGVLGAIETLGWIWGPMYGAVLVRYLSWEWQFYLNVPLAGIGIWLATQFIPDRRRSRSRIDLVGALFLTVALAASSLALLGQAKIQSATGLDELTGGTSGTLPGWVVGAVALAGWLGFVWRQRTAPSPLLDLSFPSADRRSAPTAAMAVNVAFGAALITALVNVPLLINVLISDTGDAAVRSGWVLSSLTATLAGASYAGGAMTAQRGCRQPTMLGLGIAASSLVALGIFWQPESSLVVVAVLLGFVGLGLGLAMTPSTTALTAAAGDENAGTAAGLVLVFRMIGFSLGLAALTTYGLRRFAALRADAELPPIADPGYADAAALAVRDITTDAMTDTFIAAGLTVALALVVATQLPTHTAHSN